MTVSVNGTTGITFNDASTQNTAATGFGFKNRIINGAMVIDQRNAGASVTVDSSTNFYTVDRFLGTGQSTDGVFTIQQSATAPTGFTNSLVATVTTADTSLASTQRYAVGQFIEGFNVADLGWGGANAQSITISFWVRSSLTGTFGGSVINNGFDRSYPFTYTISTANTFEYKTVTIAGDTSGTWLKTNGIGLRIYFSLGAGTDRSGTAGAWNSNNNFSATGAVSVIATSGATFYITGVQLEKGSTATSFDYRPYGTELALCQRYYETSYEGVKVPTNNASSQIINGIGSTTYVGGGAGSVSQSLNSTTFKVTKRAAPTMVIYSYASSTTSTVSNGWSGADLASGSGTLGTANANSFNIYNATGSSITVNSYAVMFNYSASAEL
jgi:hypothetical protein